LPSSLRSGVDEDAAGGLGIAGGGIADQKNTVFGDE
jgi:hypothetical protein